MNSNYLIVKEVAAILGKCEKWVYLHQKEIPGYFVLAGSIFFDKEVFISTIKRLSSRHRTN